MEGIVDVFVFLLLGRKVNMEILDSLDNENVRNESGRRRVVSGSNVCTECCLLRFSNVPDLLTKKKNFKAASIHPSLSRYPTILIVSTKVQETVFKQLT